MTTSVARMTQHRANEDRGGGLDPRPAAVAQGEHERGERRGDDGRDKDRRGDRPEQDRDPDEDEAERDRGEQPPADGGQSLEPAGDEPVARRHGRRDLAHGRGPLLRSRPGRGALGVYPDEAGRSLNAAGSGPRDGRLRLRRRPVPPPPATGPRRRPTPSRRATRTLRPSTSE